MPLRQRPEGSLAALAATALLWTAPSAGQQLEPLLGLDAYLAIPAANPLTADKVALGKRLFFDKNLSADRSISCAGCHEPERAFTDSRPVAVGVFGSRGTRRVPKLVNRGFGTSFFWDGSADSLEEQVFKPILNPLEMALTEGDAVDRVTLDPSYARTFGQVFGSPPSRQSIAFALASYVRTIRSGAAPYDRYTAGTGDALSAGQRRGLQIFRGRGNCVVCHLGPNFTDEEFHNTGIGWMSGKPADIGRAQVTGASGDTGAFKTPTLREASLTPPYMHDGSLATLRAVIDFYDDGGIENPYLDQEIVPLGLTEPDKDDLEAFLGSLNGRIAHGL